MFKRLRQMWLAWWARRALREDLIGRIRSGEIPVSRGMIVVHDRKRYSLPFRFDGHDYEVRLVMVHSFQTIRLFQDGVEVGRDLFSGEGIMRAALDRMDADEAR